MGLAVVSVASGGLPVVETTFGMPVTEATNGRGLPVTKVVGKPGLPVTFVGAAAVASAGFNPATVVNVALTNNNLTVTHITATGGSGARVLPVASTGKYYFEVKTVSGNGDSDMIGLLVSNSPYSDLNSAINCVAVLKQGGMIFANNIDTTKTVQGAIVANDVLGFAVDFTARRAWIRRNATLWNNDVTANPETGVAGVVVAAVVAMSPVVYFNGSSTAIGDQCIANFGGTSFAQTPPAGFGNWPAA
jgi:hypothetical protein